MVHNFENFRTPQMSDINTSDDEDQASQQSYNEDNDDDQVIAMFWGIYNTPNN